MTKIKSLDDIPEFQQFQKYFNEVNMMAALSNRNSAIPIAAVKEATALVFDGASLLKNQFQLENFVDRGEFDDGVEIDQGNIDRLKGINEKIEAILAEHFRPHT